MNILEKIGEKLIKHVDKVEQCLMLVIGLGFIFIVLSSLRPVEYRQIEVKTEDEVMYEEFLDSLMRVERDYEMAYWNGKNKMKVTVTRYNPEPSQCYGDPLVTADNSRIDLEKLEAGNLKWVAVSRDLRKYYPYGSKIVILSDDPDIRGIWEVHDTMHEKWKARIDLLSPSSIRTGKWHNIDISLVDEEKEH